MGFIKIKRWPLILLLLAVLTLTLLLHYGSHKIETRLGHLELPGMSITNQQVSFSLKKRSLTVTNSTVIAQYHEDSIAILIDSVHLYGIHLTDLLLRKNLKADSLRVYQPGITFSPGDTLNTHSGLPVTERPDIHIGDIKVVQGSAITTNQQKDTLVNIPSFDIQIEALSTSTSLPLHKMIGNYQLTAHSIKVLSLQEGTLEIDRITCDPQGWNIQNTSLKPFQDKLEFSRNLHFQKDWIAAAIPEIRINPPELTLLKDSIFQTDHIAIRGLQLDVFRDKLLPRDERYKPMISQLLRTLPIEMKIDSVTISEASLTYAERIREGNSFGSISIDNIATTVERINTVEKDTIKVSFDTTMPQNGIITGACYIPLGSENEHFWMNIYMQDINFNLFNSFTETNMNLRNSGVVNNAYINISGNNFEANGRSLVNYEEFKITLLNKRTGQQKKVFSDLANLLVKSNKENNLEKSFTVKRKQDRSFFNYMWLCTEKAMLVSML